MSEHDEFQAMAIGDSGSRARIDTPALVLDLDILEANIAAMAGFCRSAGIALRPHAKTHKSSMIARRQIAAGAVGIGCATIDEAEAMVEAGLPGVVITSPVVTPEKFSRVAALLQRAPDLALVIDDPAVLPLLDRASATAGRPLGVLIDVDIGQRRTGVTSEDAALSLARAVVANPGLRFAGIQAYGGHLQHISGYADRQAAVRAADEQVERLVGKLAAQGMRPAIVTGAGTGTHRLDTAGKVFTELQAGSYAVMDAEYADVEFAPGQAWPFRPALFVQVTVISANVPGQVTTDGGTKAFALNGPAPRIASGPLAGAVYGFSGDEHGQIDLPAGDAAPPVGTKIECIVPHCDPTVALYDTFHCVRGDRVVDLWPIDARGRRSPALLRRG